MPPTLRAKVAIPCRTLKQGNLSVERTQEYGARIRRSVKQAVNLISNLLDFAKIQSGTFSVDRVPEKIAEVVPPVAENMRTLAEAKNIALQFELDADLPVISCDANRIGQVLSNLLGNAINLHLRTERFMSAVRAVRMASPYQ